MFTYIFTPPLGANFFPKKSLHLERPTSPFFGPSVKFCRFLGAKPSLEITYFTPSLIAKKFPYLYSYLYSLFIFLEMLRPFYLVSKFFFDGVPKPKNWRKCAIT